MRISCSHCCTLSGLTTNPLSATKGAHVPPGGRTGCTMRRLRVLVSGRSMRAISVLVAGRQLFFSHCANKSDHPTNSRTSCMENTLAIQDGDLENKTIDKDANKANTAASEAKSSDYDDAALTVKNDTDESELPAIGADAGATLTVGTGKVQSSHAAGVDALEKKDVEVGKEVKETFDNLKLAVKQIAAKADTPEAAGTANLMKELIGQAQQATAKKVDVVRKVADKKVEVARQVADVKVDTVRQVAEKKVDAVRQVAAKKVDVARQDAAKKVDVAAKKVDVADKMVDIAKKKVDVAEKKVDVALKKMKADVRNTHVLADATTSRSVYKVHANYNDVCIGMIPASNQPGAPNVMAVCQKPPDGTCPAYFNDSCVELKHVGASVMSAKVSMF